MNIDGFISSWALFAEPYALTLLASVVLAMVGVVAMARRQVFMAAAVAQASTFGYAIFTLIVGALAIEAANEFIQDTVILGAAVAAALVTMLGQGNQAQGGRLDGDERTAWVFIISGAGAVLVLAQSPAGMEQFRRLQASSVIGATSTNLAEFGALLIFIITVLLLAGRSLVLLLADPVMASAIGTRVGRWNIGLAVFCGICVGLGVRSAGMLFTFGCLVIPVMIAKQTCGNVRSLFLVSPVIACSASLIGLWLSYIWDLPPGQVVVVLLCVLLIPAYIVRRLQEH